MTLPQWVIEYRCFDVAWWLHLKRLLKLIRWPEKVEMQLHFDAEPYLKRKEFSATRLRKTTKLEENVSALSIFQIFPSVSWVFPDTWRKNIRNNRVAPCVMQHSKQACRLGCRLARSDSSIVRVAEHTTQGLFPPSAGKINRGERFKVAECKMDIWRECWSHKRERVKKSNSDRHWKKL
jgi:hypothetical protein